MILKSKNKNFTNIDKPYIDKKIVDVNKVIVSNKVIFSKKGFNYFIGYKDSKKIDLYTYFSQK